MFMKDDRNSRQEFSCLNNTVVSYDKMYEKLQSKIFQPNLISHIYHDVCALQIQHKNINPY